MRMLPTLPEVPNDALAFSALAAVLETLRFPVPNADAEAACDRADVRLLGLAQSKSPELRAFGDELSDWLARAV